MLVPLRGYNPLDALVPRVPGSSCFKALSFIRGAKKRQAKVKAGTSDEVQGSRFRSKGGTTHSFAVGLCVLCLTRCLGSIHKSCGDR